MYSAAPWVVIDSGDRQEFIDVSDITHIEGEGGNTRIFTRHNCARNSARSLMDWEKRLKGGDFVRVHRSAIVNLKHVERVEPWFQYGYRIKLKGFPEPVIMSRRHAARLRDVLG